MKKFFALFLFVALIASCGEKAETGEEEMSGDMNQETATDDMGEEAPEGDIAETTEQETMTAEIDQSAPEKLVMGIFEAAKANNLESLAGLCAEGADNDAMMICEAASAGNDEFVMYFSKGSLNGEVMIEGDMAEVPILFGPEGAKEETLKLQKVGDKWYLHSF